MANQLDELTGPINENGRDINVIHKQLPIKTGAGSIIFQVVLWLFIIPGFIFWIMKIKAGNYFNKLEQSIQASASEIDNQLEQRVVILQNASKLLDKAIDLDKDTFTSIAKLRAGANQEASRNEIAAKIDSISKQVNLAFENYPDLKAHASIADAMQQNNYLQKEITAARTKYNDYVLRWNQDIQIWPTKKIVAAKRQYTTRIPFTTTSEIKTQARETFF